MMIGINLLRANLKAFLFLHFLGPDVFYPETEAHPLEGGVNERVCLSANLSRGLGGIFQDEILGHICRELVIRGFPVIERLVGKFDDFNEGNGFGNIFVF